MKNKRRANLTQIALLGFGKIAQNQHIPAIEKLNLPLNAIIDSTVKPSLNVPFFSDLDSFLNEDESTDLVSITTPNGLHFEHAVKCLNHGKHILIEKPITLHSEDAEILINLANEKNLKVFSSMQLRLSPVVQFVKNLLKNQDLGEIYMVNINCYWNRNQEYYNSKSWHGTKELDGGVLFTQFSHFIDILGYWFNELNVNSAQFFNFNHKECCEFADSGNIQFEADNAKGNMIFTTSTYPKNFESSITILAEKGTIQVGDQYLNQFKYFNVEGIEQPHFSDEKAFHPELYKEIVSALEENRPSIADGKHALKLVKFVEEAHQLGTPQEKEFIHSSKQSLD